MDYLDTNNDIFTYNGKLATRMACHMGDHGAGKASALCNILGDQPLFYIDYVDEEEADFIDPMSLDMSLGDMMLDEEAYFVPGHAAPATPEDMSHLRRRIARLEGACAHIDGYMKPEVADAFDAATATIGTHTTQTTAQDILTALQNSRFLTALYEDVQDAGVTLKTSNQIDRAAYDREQKTVYVNPGLSATDGAIAAATALRQAWLHQKGAAIHPLHFAPEEAVLLNRIQTADLAATALRTAWEFKLAGNEGPWARMLTGSAYDLGQSFAREAIADFRALNNGVATNAAFEKWFFSGRCKEVDRKLIQSMLADNHGLVFNHPEVSKMVTADIIARTGDQPQGKNYLTGLVEVILADPLFTEVRDRSNANFLWFIKFERSFRATDNAVQTASPAAQTPDTATQQTASVVSFPARGKKARKTAADGQDGATVYYLDHFLSLSNR